MRFNPASFSEYDHHERVVDLADLDPKLAGYIAIHSTRPGPAIGGTRAMAYESTEAAVADALRLSKTMTFKCAISGLRFGGGKGVLIIDPKREDFREILKRYAHAVDTLKGTFYTGEDVGLSEADVQWMLQYSQYFVGHTGQAGDPSQFASLSVLKTLEVALRHVFGDADFAGRRFSVKGAGKTGSELVRLLSERGAKVWVADYDLDRVQELVARFPGVRAAEVAESHRLPVDVYCPCALGGDLTLEIVPQIQAKIIAGTANNPIAEPAVSQLLYEKGILLVPDFIANAGGLINVADELLQGGYNRERVISGIEELKRTLDQVLRRSEQLHRPPDRIALDMAQHVIGLQKKAEPRGRPVKTRVESAV